MSETQPSDGPQGRQRPVHATVLRLGAFGVPLLVVYRTSRPRIEEDNALKLSHGRGLTEYEGHSYGASEVAVDPAKLGLGRHLAQLIDRWVQTWTDLAEGLPLHTGPEHCREFDIQRYNRAALHICRAVSLSLPAERQVCFFPAKRKGAAYRSELLSRAQQAPGRLGVSREPRERDPEKWVRIMGDYSASGVWDWQGYMVTSEWLPISPELRRWLDSWASRYVSTCDAWWHGNHENFEEIVRNERRVLIYAEEGLALAAAIKAALPDWTVVYHNESLSMKGAAKRSEFEFEVE